MTKKLIEVALPLEAINAEAAREKSIRHGHPSTLHLWWSRKPLAACRAVLFASLVDDPSSHPEQFPTEEAVMVERQRLFRLIERLVTWENIGDDVLYEEIYAEILKSTDGNPPPVLDPFAGGGSIPLEAQRLGLEAHASDLNPVAVLINKALIEIPPRFVRHAPVNTEAQARIDAPGTWKGASGLAEDVRYYGEWMKQQAEKRVGYLYHKAKLPDGSEATVIAWKWARTVKCPNPACGAEMPLASGHWLSKKKGSEAWVEICSHSDHVSYKVHYGLPSEDDKRIVDNGTGFINEKGKRTQATFLCPVCKSGIAKGDYIDNEACNGRMNVIPMAVVASTKKGRQYLSFTKEQHNEIKTLVERHMLSMDVEAKAPRQECKGTFASNAMGRRYGFFKFSDYFTQRQLSALVTFSDLVGAAIGQAREDAAAAGLPDDEVGLDDDGRGAKAYSEAVGVYLACAVDKAIDYNSSLCSWNVTRDGLRNTFARQAIPMIWDFAESNPFSDKSGCWNNCVEWVVKCLQCATPNANGYVVQRDAMQMTGRDSIVISTDPPYYDNISYADLSDFFYVWLRRSLREVYPNLFSTMLVPKAEELVATPYRFAGSTSRARDFFEEGMLRAFSGMRATASPNYPLTVYYAFKQSESVENGNGNGKDTASIGWESMLQALIHAGFVITGTCLPVRNGQAAQFLSTPTH